MRHRGFRIELGGALERAKRLLVVEAEEQRHALVEVLLRLGVRRLDGMPVRAHAAEQLRRFFRLGRVRVRGVLGTEHRSDTGEGHREQGSFHGRLLVEATGGFYFGTGLAGRIGPSRTKPFWMNELFYHSAVRQEELARRAASPL